MPQSFRLIFSAACTLIVSCLLLTSLTVNAAPTLLSETDKHPSVTLSNDQLGASFSEWSHRAARSTIGIQPGSGLYYFEGHREVDAGNFGFGVATAAAPIDNFGGFTDQSIGVNALGYIYYNNASQLPGSPDATLASNTYYGLAIDYRASNPVVYVILDSGLFYTQTLDQISDELFIFVYGTTTTAGIQQSINAGDDLATSPFQYDVEVVLNDAGVSNTNELILGWQNAQTRITIDIEDTTANLGDTVNLSGTAYSADGTDISSTITWLNSTSGTSSTGANFSVTSAVAAIYTITATVFDESAEPVIDSVTVTFAAPDSDNDGLTDSEEALLGTDPNQPDSDSDGLSDGDEVNIYATLPLETDSDSDGMDDFYEVTYSLNPNDASDANIDADGDSYSNSAEYAAGTDPQNSSAYPGAPSSARLSETDKHSSIAISADGFGAEFTLSGHHGVRSDLAIDPSSGFYYFEGHREGPAGNYGFGVATSTETLANFGGVSNQSIGVNALGFVYYNGSSVAGSSIPEITSTDYFGIAIDYRNTTPIAYVIANDQLIHTQVLSAITDPLHILVYGNPVVTGVQQTINTAADLVNTPYRYNAKAILEAAGVSGTEAITNGWTPLPPRTEIEIASTSETVEMGQPLLLSATATNAAGSDITNTIQWSDSASTQTAIGAEFAFNADSLGLHILTAQVLNESLSPVIETITITVVALDTDGDGLSDDQELIIGTQVNNQDSDADGLTDGQEVNIHGTNPLSPDSDSDGVSDALEINLGTNPNLSDSDADTDGDGFSNLDEVSSGTDPRNRYSYPGGPVGTFLDSDGTHASVVVGSAGLGVTFTDSTVRSVHSTVAIEPNSGWFYFEGKRETVRGNYGFGVATAAASTDTGIAADGQSIAITTDGYIRYNGSIIEGYLDSANNEHYGVAVDYSGNTPIVYFIVTSADGYRLALAPQPLPSITEALYITVFGEAQGGIQQASINAGDDPEAPFHYPAHYTLFNAGYPGAEFLGQGWGALHTYSGVEEVSEHSDVHFSLDSNSGSGIELSTDQLSATYDIDLKMGVRANQGMIGEFRYFEGIRLVDSIVKLGDGEGLGFGYGVITEYGRINPYPFDPEQPSMSVNAVNGIWRNLNQVDIYDTNTYHYGFAVDYREARPVVHVIINDEVVHTMTLPDVFTPLFPLMYANTQGAGVYPTASNFGATPFYYDPKDALARAGIDTSAFVSGWGSANKDSDADNIRDADEAIYGTSPVDGDSDGDGIRDGDEAHIVGTSPLNSDSDGDTMPDGYELVIGTDPLVNDQAADIDNDGINNLAEFHARTDYANEAPQVTIHQGSVAIDVGQNITFSATAADIHDGDLKSVIAWSVYGSPQSTTGPTFSLTPEEGLYRIDAEVTDSDGLSTLVSVSLSVIDPASLDTDNDGLTDQYELANGLNPNNPDTDNDSLTDGEELSIHDTNPLLADSDADGMNDAFEVGYNLAPNDPSDAALDPDADGRTNLQEFEIGSDPHIPDGLPVTDIIVDNIDAGAEIISGNFDTYSASEQYGTSATYASVGGTIDRYRFTPAIELAGNYEVFAWNSCYSNRAVNVQHNILHASGLTTIEVDQDCDTGSHGEWFSLGVYSFNTGTNGYLEISDAGITPPGSTFMGADAARFVLSDDNTAPVISIDATSLTLLEGQTANLTANAIDAEDGDISSALTWSDDEGNTSSGTNYTATLPIGNHIVTVNITDSGGRTVFQTVDIFIVADDNDGLSPSEEATLGTDPANPDTDGDGLNDGDEVNNYGTDPLNSDSDNDGIDDQFELSANLNPLDASDAGADLDGDGISNLDEFLAGTDPTVFDTPAAVDIVIENGVTETSFVGSWSNFYGSESHAENSVWATVGGPEDRYRFTPNLPNSGSYEVFAWNACYGNRATNVRHIITHADGDSVIEVDQDCDTGTHGEWYSLGIYPFNYGSTGYLEITDAGISSPSTTYMGADAARFVQRDVNAAPIITIDNSSYVLIHGEALELIASALDPEDGDLSGSISWSNDLSADTGTGASFNFIPMLGSNTVTLSVSDPEGATASATITVNVVSSLEELDDDNDGLNNGDEAIYGTSNTLTDTDGDGINDGDEVHTHGTNPLLGDSDSDLMPDAFEVQYGLDPLVDDANNDLDLDGLSNYEEYNLGSDPSVALVTDIIIDTNDIESTQVGQWNDFPGNESYGGASLWAQAGGAIDRFRFTPDIPVAGEYEVLAWNSCYSNRATNVAHIIEHTGGQTLVEVDQDCDTGSHGEWLSLGIFTFNVGTANYLEITDDGLTPSSTTYMGADAARFVRQ
jgi:Bacterial TSP3 repeat